MKTSSLPLLLGLVLAVALPAGEWLDAAPGFAWDFPRDHWAHHGYKSEWWYLTGNLETAGATPRRFGYQFTFFRVGLLPDPPERGTRWRSRSLIMGHAALSDVAGRGHRFSELLYRATPLLGGFGEAPDPLLAWSRAPAGTDARWELRWNGTGYEIQARDDRRDFALELTTRPVKPRIFQGPGGLSRKSSREKAASLYYSYTRLETTGTVHLDGVAYPVRGMSWFDKEFGSSELGSDQVGWDWFSLQLADGRDLMLYVLRGEDGGLSHAQGTLVGRDGGVEYLGPEAWTLTATGRWASPENQAVYPSGWTLELPGHGLDLVVTPVFPAQENRSSLVGRMAYWEGAVDVRDPDGAAAGRGYVELTGYGRTRRPTR